MRESPITQMIFLAACLAVLLWPMLRLTGGEEVTPAAAIAVEVSAQPMIASHIELRFAHVPERVSLKVDGKNLWSSNNLQTARVAFDGALPFVEGEVEIELHVQWPVGTTETVAEVEVVPDGFDSVRQTVWGQGSLTDYLVFKIQ